MIENPIEPVPTPSDEPQLPQTDTSAPNSYPGRWRDILLLIYGVLCELFLVGRAIYLVVVALQEKGANASATLTSDVYSALAMLFIGALLLPMLVLTSRRLRGKTIRKADVPPIKLWQVALLLAVWIIVIVTGGFLNATFKWGWTAASPFFVLGITLPATILVWIAIGGIRSGSIRRLWATLGIGMTAGPIIAIGLELLFVLLGVVIAGIVAALNPQLLATLQQLKTQIGSAGNAQDLIPLLTPYLNSPWVFLVLLVFVSIVGPLIEEAFKPLAVWLVGKRLHSPAEGFALGALCGAGFALLEGLLVTSGATDMLGFSLAGRATSSIMHIMASALMGWAIASAILEKRYGRLGLTYILCVAIHGLWNGAVVLTVYGGLRLTLTGNKLDILGGLSTVGGIGLIGLLLVSIVALLPILNARFRRTERNTNDIIVPKLS